MHIIMLPQILRTWERQEKRIQEFHEDKVVGIRDGAMLLVENDSMQ
jgi:hypothetical protein